MCSDRRIKYERLYLIHTCANLCLRRAYPNVTFVLSQVELKSYLAILVDIQHVPCVQCNRSLRDHCHKRSPASDHSPDRFSAIETTCFERPFRPFWPVGQSVKITTVSRYIFLGVTNCFSFHAFSSPDQYYMAAMFNI